MEPLYCFKFNDETGEITKIEIPKYRTDYNKYTKKNTYVWSEPRINVSDSHFSVSDDKIDRFVTNKVFTFNTDYEHACEIIRNTLIEDAEKLEKQMRRKLELLNIFRAGQGKRTNL